jgi:hypothetical protein
MDAERVKDLMVPLDEYPAVPRGATLLDAIRAFDEAHRHLAPGRQPHRAVLVKDDDGRVIGKLGQLAFLRALEPKSLILRDTEKLNQAGVAAEAIDALIENYRLFEDSFADMCRRGLGVRVEEAMYPISETIEEDASLAEAVHRIVLWRQLSLLVMRGRETVGLIRLSDLCDEVARRMIRAEQASHGGRPE